MPSTDNLLERLRDMGCDREPFTSDHAKCICRLTNEAADKIERLLKLLDESETSVEKLLLERSKKPVT